MRRAFSSLAVGLLVLLSACNEEGLPVSTAGQVASADAPVITAIDQKDLGNGFVGLTAKATDPKNRPLTFTWRVDNGQLSQQTGRAVTWKVPTQPGDYTATLEVKNDTGAAATATQRFTVSQTGQVQAQGGLQVAASSGGTTVNGRFVIPSPLGSQQANPLVVGGVVVAPSPAQPTPPNSQPVATPAPATAVPTFGPAQPIALPTPTPPPEVVPPSPFPSPSPATPEPEVAQRAPVRWQIYDNSKIPAQGVNWNALHFLSPTKGYIAGAGGTVLHYNRTGDTEPAFVSRSSGIPATMTINKIRFASETAGFIAGTGSRVMRTTDGALNWEDVSPPVTLLAGDFTTLIVTNAQIATVADGSGRVYRNEAMNAPTAAEVIAGWVQLNTQPNDRPTDVSSRIYGGTGMPGDPTMFYFAGYEGIFRLDTDNPDATKVWNRVYTYKAAVTGDVGDQWAEQIGAANSTEVWAGTMAGSLLRLKAANTGTPTIVRTPADKYDNREANGNGVFLPRAGEISALHVLDANNGFFSHTGGVYDTIDGALEWRRLPEPRIAFKAMQVDFVNEDGKTSFRGFGVGMAGAVYIYKSGI